MTALVVGSATLRTALYMATLAATCFNPVIRALYQCLLAAGKAKKVALVACMRQAADDLECHRQIRYTMERKFAHPGGRKCLTFKTVAYSLVRLLQRRPFRAFTLHTATI